MQKFHIDVWFDRLPDHIKLGNISVYADNEAEALELAKNHTHYEVSGVDDTRWLVRERATKAYAKA